MLRLMLNLGQPIAKLVNLIPDEMDQGQFGRRIVRHYSPHPTTPPRRVASGGISPLQLWAADAVRAALAVSNCLFVRGGVISNAGMVSGESPEQLDHPRFPGGRDGRKSRPQSRHQPENYRRPL